jgi:hypothetical protein
VVSVTCADCTADKMPRGIHIEFCPLHAAAPDLLEALRELTDGATTGPDLMCHRGLCSEGECGRCGRILRARAAIAKAEVRS